MMKRMLSLLVLLFPLSICAAEIENLGSSGEFYLLKIDNKIYRAMTDEFYTALNKGIKGDTKALKEQIVELKQKLLASQALVEKYEALRQEQVELTKQYRSLNADHSKLNTDFSKVSGDLVQLNQQYGVALNDFDKLIDEYRKVALRTNPRNKLDVGVGMLSTTGTSHTFLMAGSGVKLLNKELRGWLFVGNDSYGAMVGLSF